MTEPLSKKRFPKAVFFDFDGILVDTEPLHYAAFTEAFRPEGLDFSREEYDQVYIGFDDRDAVDTAARARGRNLADDVRQRLLRTKVDAFTRLVRETRLAPLPGVQEWIQLLRKRRIPIALCSGALRCDIDPVLDRIGLAAAFAIRVTADDVAHSKPDPASYRLAHERLCRHVGRTFPPGQCLAIEDTPTGIASARGAGLRVLGVTTNCPAAALSEADYVVSSLKDVYPDDLTSKCNNP